MSELLPWHIISKLLQCLYSATRPYIQKKPYKQDSPIPIHTQESEPGDRTLYADADIPCLWAGCTVLCSTGYGKCYIKPLWYYHTQGSLAHSVESCRVGGALECGVVSKVTRGPLLVKLGLTGTFHDFWSSYVGATEVLMQVSLLCLLNVRLFLYYFHCFMTFGFHKIWYRLIKCSIVRQVVLNTGYC